MTDDFSVPGPAAAGPLAAVVARVAELADRVGATREEVFRLSSLSAESGVPADVVEELLAGRAAGDSDLQTRFLRRFALLRRTRLKPDGRRYTQQEIADGAGMSRQQAGALINGDRRPTMEHCAAIQRFFKVHAGFLTAEDAEALAGALQRVEEELRRRHAAQETALRRDSARQDSMQEDPVVRRDSARREEAEPLEAQPQDEPLEPAADPGSGPAPDDTVQRLLRHHGVRGIAWRAAQLPTDKHRDTVTEWLDMLLENVKKPES